MQTHAECWRYLTALGFHIIANNWTQRMQHLEAQGKSKRIYFPRKRGLRARQIPALRHAEVLRPILYFGNGA